MSLGVLATHPDLTKTNLRIERNIVVGRQLTVPKIFTDTLLANELEVEMIVIEDALFDTIDVNDTANINNLVVNTATTGPISSTSITTSTLVVTTGATGDIVLDASTALGVQIGNPAGTNAGNHLTVYPQSAPPSVVGGGDAVFFNLVGSDTAGVVILVTTAGSLAGQATVTFNLAYNTPPSSVVICPGPGALGLEYQVSAVTVSSFTISYVTPAGVGTAHSFNYIVIG